MGSKDNLFEIRLMFYVLSMFILLIKCATLLFLISRTVFKHSYFSFKVSLLRRFEELLQE